ncbi:aldo/keto reductase [Haloarculaceae archaeon H-GB2-1]|nr:aldo/keto reductase [Haloarculaceae archaeon H-GB1-1]MEA5387991.1 aldo/keto reductase [Haloarculaceae archaeon H-GB11]MEA5409481.1 aldo/keto reductase [Haloarculaceae archaeon H-GB2-1]
MEYTYLGSTGLEVSKLCLGTGLFGSGYRPTETWHGCMDDEEASIELVHRARELGINFIDTANQYSTGEAEEIVGKAISEYDRDEMVVQTKVWDKMFDGPNGSGLSRKHVLDQAAASRERLGTDYIDVYMAHAYDPNTPLRETLAAFDQLVSQGDVRYVGASNFDESQLMKALWIADREGYQPISSTEPEYSLIAREEEWNALRPCAREGIGVTPYSPLGKGLLAGAYDREEKPSESSRIGHRVDSQWDWLNTEENWAVFDVVQELAETKDVTPVQISIAWVLHKDVVDSVIIGPTTVDELEECVGAVDVSLSDDDMERLEAPVQPAYKGGWSEQ